MNLKNELESNNRVESRVIELEQLFASRDLLSEQSKPITNKLRTILRQLDLNLEIDPASIKNRYLKRLLDECRLFLNEAFEWQNYWEYNLAYKVEGCWLKCSLDLMISSEGEILLLDWSGIENNPLLPMQVYLVCLKLNIAPNKVRTVSLVANSLKEERLICFVRQNYYTNDLVIAKQNLEEALGAYDKGLLLPSESNWESVEESSLEEILQELDAAPEIAI